jgi:ABC-type transport system substrate-binding protein
VQPRVEQALAARGEERRQLMEQLADITHDEVLMIPLFDYLVVWGLNDKLEWEPRWDRRIRFNNMSFRP